MIASFALLAPLRGPVRSRLARAIPCSRPYREPATTTIGPSWQASGYARSAQPGDRPISPVDGDRSVVGIGQSHRGDPRGHRAVVPGYHDEPARDLRSPDRAGPGTSAPSMARDSAVISGLNRAMTASTGLPSCPAGGADCLQAASAAAGSHQSRAFEEPEHLGGLPIRMHQADDQRVLLLARAPLASRPGNPPIAATTIARRTTLPSLSHRSIFSPRSYGRVMIACHSPHEINGLQ